MRIRFFWVEKKTNRDCVEVLAVEVAEEAVACDACSGDWERHSGCACSGSDSGDDSMFTDRNRVGFLQSESFFVSVSLSKVLVADLLVLVLG